MATFDYTQMQALAQRLLTKFGQTMTLHRMVDGVKASDETVTGAVFDQAARERAMESVGVSARRVLLAAADLTTPPTLMDQLAIGGVDYAILDVLILAPGGVPVTYELQVRA